jgi:ferredoxin-NADP reductase
MPQFQAVVRAVVVEAPGAVTLLLDPGERLEYRAGQFLSIDPFGIDATRGLAADLEARKGRKERPRAYSLASAPHEPLLAICPKAEPAGDYPSLLSPHLAHGVKVGDALPCSGFNGLYVLPDDLPAGAHVVHVCAGSGIVPNFAIIKDALHRGLDARHTLLYSNRTWADAIYRDALTELETRHPGRLRVVHALTRDHLAPDGREVHPGRIDEALLRAAVPDLANARFFACGPSVSAHELRAARLRGDTPAPRFLEHVRALLLSMGVDKRRLHTEGW